MKDYIEERVLEVAAYILETGASVRKAAEVFKYSKSTIHKDMTQRLFEINRSMAFEVRKVLDTNKAERHIRGGEATRRKYS
ncbi:MAG: sporulation transcriptional regulator SpoIIID [Clostridia bacterium]|nr:sporulation transcriptional regulator SpoIIID [Clostridia bacterium]